MIPAGQIDYIIIEMCAGNRAQTMLEEAGYRGFLMLPSTRTCLAAERVEQGRFGDYLFIRPGLTLPFVQDRLIHPDLASA